MAQHITVIINGVIECAGEAKQVPTTDGSTCWDFEGGHTFVQRAGETTWILTESCDELQVGSQCTLLLMNLADALSAGTISQMLDDGRLTKVDQPLLTQMLTDYKEDTEIMRRRVPTVAAAVADVTINKVLAEEELAEYEAVLAGLTGAVAKLPLPE